MARLVSVHICEEKAIALSTQQMPQPEHYSMEGQIS